MKINLNIEADSVEELEAALARLVGNLETTASAPAIVAATTVATPATRIDGYSETAATSPAPVTAQRERGKPAPGSGRTRRTKEEIAEDDAAERAEAQGQTVVLSDDTSTTSAFDSSDDNLPEFITKADEPNTTPAMTTAATSTGEPVKDEALQSAIGVVIDKVSFEAAKAVLAKHNIGNLKAASGFDTAKRQAILDDLIAAANPADSAASLY